MIKTSKNIVTFLETYSILKNCILNSDFKKCYTYKGRNGFDECNLVLQILTPEHLFELYVSTQKQFADLTIKNLANLKENYLKFTINEFIEINKPGKISDTVKDMLLNLN